MTLQETLLRTFVRDHPVEAASLLGEQTDDEAAAVLAMLPDEAATGLLGRAATSIGAGALSRLPAGRASGLLARLPPERAAALLRSLEPGVREGLLAGLPGAERLRALIAYPAGTAGALMDPSVLALPATLELAAARQRLGESSAHVAIEVYLVDAEHRLVGVADLREVLAPDRTGELASLARGLEPLRESADLESVSAHPGWLQHDTLPVVDGRGTYLGAVRGERLRQVVHEATTLRSRRGTDATLALGELFWLGLTGLLSSLAPGSPKEAE
jgi:Mg/Co/Ni transporter MgtE